MDHRGRRHLPALGSFTVWARRQASAATNAATHAEGILTLTIEDLDLKFHRARVPPKGSTIDYVL
ncbi:hypothetical protein [Nonomuraea sp. NPDC001699]